MGSGDSKGLENPFQLLLAFSSLVLLFFFVSVLPQIHALIVREILWPRHPILGYWTHPCIAGRSAPEGPKAEDLCFPFVIFPPLILAETPFPRRALYIGDRIQSWEFQV